jgi:hypothetical protein
MLPEVHRELLDGFMESLSKALDELEKGLAVRTSEQLRVELRRSLGLPELENQLALVQAARVPDLSWVNHRLDDFELRMTKLSELSDVVYETRRRTHELEKLTPRELEKLTRRLEKVEDKITAMIEHPIVSPEKLNQDFRTLQDRMKSLARHLDVLEEIARLERGTGDLPQQTRRTRRTQKG